MEDEWITIGIVCKLPIEEIPEIKRYLDNKGMIIYSKISAGKLILKEDTLPSGGVYDRE